MFPAASRPAFVSGQYRLQAARLNGFTRIHDELEQNPNGAAIKLVAVKS